MLALVATVLSLAGASPLPGLPAYTAGYRSWTKLNAKPIPPNRDGDAHLGTKNVYASRLPRSGSALYPVGTVIVKDITRPGARFVGVVAAMRKVAGVKANNGWKMIEWSRPSARSRFTVLAQGQLCFSCHVGAKRTDYVFTRRVK
ncbi:MAG: cytochrome P460 family protein [Gaiellaceae bacterium]